MTFFEAILANFSYSYFLIYWVGNVSYLNPSHFHLHRYCRLWQDSQKSIRRAYSSTIDEVTVICVDFEYVKDVRC